MLSDARILNIDLTTGEISERILAKEVYEKYPGGSSLGTFILLNELKPGIEPLSEENIMVFSVSPLTGLPISGNSRMCVNAKSPLTGTIGDSQVGGYIGPHIKANGFDAIVIRGKAEKPVYIYISKGRIHIKDADFLWGKVTGDAEKLIAVDLGTDKTESSIIGPAGENLVRYASIMHRRSRANGRNGMGAVMGSKNLKAVVVEHGMTIKPYDLDGFKKLTKTTFERLEKNEAMKEIAVHGTAGYGDVLMDEGLMPSYNFLTGTMDDIKNVGGYKMSETILKTRETCYACGIRCKRAVYVEGKADPFYGGPEFETCGSLGTYCGNNDMSELARANQLCNMYGLDTISCGATIAFAMECYEKGLITKQQTGGIELKFGNNVAIGDVIPLIAKRQGWLWKLLGEGSKRAAAEIGKDAEKIVVASKGQEWPAHMVQMKPNLALHYAVNPFGADHQTVEHDVCLLAPKDSQDWLWPLKLDTFEECSAYGVLNNNKAKYTAVTQKFYSCIDTLCLCSLAWGLSYQLFGPEELIALLKSGIDWDVSIQDLLLIGERKNNMMRLFNQREGFCRKDDIVPERAYIKIPQGPNKGLSINREDFEAALDSYYEFVGWDIETGNPTEETIKRLGLTWATNGKQTEGS